jgi:uncharacterized protein YeaO (DUF488 family)
MLWMRDGGGSVTGAPRSRPSAFLAHQADDGYRIFSTSEDSMVRIKRAYEEPASIDGYRVLVDRLWPRGMKKDEIRLDLWAKDVAPSPSLRRWFGHDPARFSEFARRYATELREEPAATLLAQLVRRAAHGTVTLVYGARDEEHNGAVVLRDEIMDALRTHAG